MKKNFTLSNCLSLFIMILTANCFAQTSVWTGNTNTNWNTPENWSPQVIPTLTTEVVIPVTTSGNYPVIDGNDGTANCNNLTVQQATSVIVTSDNGTLRIGGEIYNEGIIDATDGTIVMRGGLTQEIPENVFYSNTIKNLTVYNTVGVNLNGELGITGILQIVTGIFNTNDLLILKSNELTTAVVDEIEQGNITGNVTVERYIPARRAFRLLSPSTTGGTVNSNWQEGQADIAGYGTDITGTGAESNGFDPSGTNNPSLFMHDNENAVWQPVTNTLEEELIAGTPYRIMVRGDRTVDQGSNSAVPTNTILRTHGTLLTGSVLKNDLSQNPGGFSFVGNPYQAPVDMESVLSSAVNVNENFYYIWDPTVNTRGAYVTVNVQSNSNNFEGSEANKYLQPNQAFFVQTRFAGPASLLFKEEDKFITSAENANLYRTVNPLADASLQLTMYTAQSMLENGTAADGFVVRFGNSYSNDVDSNDAVKPQNQDENIGILNGESILSFESRNTPTANDVINISNTAYRATEYVYTVKVNGLDGVTAYLIDKFENTTTELANNETTSYSFSVNPADESSIANNRFDIVFEETALNTGSFAKQSFTLYPNPVTNNQFNIEVDNPEMTDVSIFNQLGQQISCSTNQASGNTIAVTANTNLAPGVYMVQVRSQGNSSTKKIIVK